MSNKQSSVDWLWSFVEPSLTDAQKYFFSMIIEEARVKHKEETIDAIIESEKEHYSNSEVYPPEFVLRKAEKYYNETFGGNNEQQ